MLVPASGAARAATPGPTAGAEATRQSSIDPTSAKYGAKCDGVTDDSAAFARAFADLGSANYQAMHIPAGNCLIRSLGFSIPGATGYGNIAIEGEGSGATTITYAGAARDGDFWSFGSPNGGNCGISHFSFRRLRFVSRTPMRAGAALKFTEICELNVEDLSIAGGDDFAARNWWNGVHFNGGHSLYLRNYNLEAVNDAETVNGLDQPAQLLIDIFQTQGVLQRSGVGLRIAGAVGGFNGDQTDVVTNGRNVVIDQSQTGGGPRDNEGRANVQLFFGRQWQIDATDPKLGSGVAFEIRDGGNQSSLIDYSGWIGTGAPASDPQPCVIIYDNSVSPNGWKIRFSGQVVNCHPPKGSGAVQNLNTAKATTIVFQGVQFQTGNAIAPFLWNAPGANPLRLQQVSFGDDLGGALDVSGAWVGDSIDGLGQRRIGSAPRRP